MYKTLSRSRKYVFLITRIPSNENKKTLFDYRRISVVNIEEIIEKCRRSSHFVEFEMARNKINIEPRIPSARVYAHTHTHTYQVPPEIFSGKDSFH